MLSAHKLGQKGVEYYVSYAGRGTEGYWLGKAAASLGLVGAVDPAVFRALAKGEHPDGGRLLERVATDHTPGWDFTLSAPKSVSLAWALADEPLRAALAEAHRGAVAAAFSFLEDEGGRARRGFGGRDGHVPAGLAVACFVHPASRELDPQLHTHGIVCNVVEGSDGRWTALDSRMIYLHRRAAASIYPPSFASGWPTRWPMARSGPARPVRARGLRARGAAQLLATKERDRGGARAHRAVRAKGERGGVSEDETRQGRRRARGAARHLGRTCPGARGDP